VGIPPGRSRAAIAARLLRPVPEVPWRRRLDGRERRSARHV